MRHSCLLFGLVTFCRSLSEFVGVCRSLSEFVDNISLRSVYDTAKRTCGGDMLTAEGAVGRVCRSLYNSLLEFVGVCRSLSEFE